MIKNGGESANFEITSTLLFSQWDYKYDGGFRMFITPYSDDRNIDLVKGGEMTSGNKIEISDHAGNKLFELPAQKWIDLAIKVDMDAQMYVVSYSYSSGGQTVSETTQPISLPNAVSDMPYTLNSVGNVGFAKDKASASGSFYLRNIAVKEEADPAVNVLFSDDFNDRNTNGWGLLRNNPYSPMNISAVEYKGHKAMLVERAKAVNISDPSRTDGNPTHYGTVNEDGSFVQDTAGVGGSGPSRIQAVYVTLPKSINVNDNVYLEFDAHMANKSWKYDSAQGKHTDPRDTMYVSLGSDPMNVYDYMEYAFSSGAIQRSDKGTAGTKILPSAANSYFNWHQNGPCAEWVTSSINNNANKTITYKINGSAADKNSFAQNAAASAAIDKLAFSINYYNGGACYIDNVKVYTRDESIVEALDTSKQTVSPIAVELKAPNGSFIIGSIGDLTAGTEIDSVKISNYTGDLTQGAFVAAALYHKDNDGKKRLADAVCSEVILADIENTVTFTKPLILPDDISQGGYTVRIFLFDGIKTLTPLSDRADFVLQGE